MSKPKFGNGIMFEGTRDNSSGHGNFWGCTYSQSTFVCSASTMKKLEQYVKSVQWCKHC